MLTCTDLISVRPGQRGITPQELADRLIAEKPGRFGYADEEGAEAEGNLVERCTHEITLRGDYLEVAYRVRENRRDKEMTRTRTSIWSTCSALRRERGMIDYISSSQDGYFHIATDCLGDDQAKVIGKILYVLDRFQAISAWHDKVQGGISLQLNDIPKDVSSILIMLDCIVCGLMPPDGWLPTS